MSSDILELSLFSSTYGTILTSIKFNNFGTQCLNGPRYLFHSFCCTTQCIFEPLHVYKPSFNMDKYSTYLKMEHFSYKSGCDVCNCTHIEASKGRAGLNYR